MQATDENNTPAGAAACPADLPSILDLGRHLRILRDAYHEADLAALAAHDTPEAERQRDRMGRLHDRNNAISDLVLTMEARTLGDAVVQLVLADEVADICEGCNSDIDDYKRTLTVLRRMLASVTPIISVAAGVPVEAVAP